MTLAIHHLAVMVRDLERAERFYVGVLGLPVTQRWTDDQGLPRSIWVELSAGAFLAIEKATASGARTDDDPGWHCVTLGISSLEREPWRTRLEAAGHPVVRASDFTLYVRDPEGNLIGLSHWPVRAVSRVSPTS